MRRGRFTEDQIIGVLREHEAGVKTGDLCRKHGISDATFYNWKSKYGGLTVSDAARLRALEDENRQFFGASFYERLRRKFTRHSRDLYDEVWVDAATLRL